MLITWREIHMDNVGKTLSTSLRGYPQGYPEDINIASSNLILLDADLLSNRFQLFAKVAVFLQTVCNHVA